MFPVGECRRQSSPTALRRSLVSTFATGSNAPEDPGGPAVLLLSDEIELLTQTPQTDAYLRALLPTDVGRSPVPAAAYNVAAQLLAREEGVDEHPPLVRVHLRDGLWVTLRAARIEQGTARVTAAIAVSIEPTPPCRERRSTPVSSASASGNRSLCTTLSADTTRARSHAACSCRSTPCRTTSSRSSPRPASTIADC